ncbi:MAG: PhoH family protein [Gammaproteobacteria bacterium]|nr:PhoH family protein [Gammaproteobacteria bacterium]
MNARLKTLDFTLEPADNLRLASLCGQFDEHLRQIERRLGVEINSRGNTFRVIGAQAHAQAARDLMHQLYDETGEETEALTPQRVHLFLQQASLEALAKPDAEDKLYTIQTKRGLIKPRGANQQQYVHAIRTHDIAFGIGPAGTGKTYLAVACAVDALERGEVSRIVLTRPAVEAGERLGFLPGDLTQKIDPYLRPLYDALYEMLGFEKVAKFMERNIIEVAPLAFMRGRTLNDSFIILDESQNTTVEQMKMLLTRIGFGSRAVVTGDITQIDLPRGKASGLRHAIEVLRGVDKISFTFFQSNDVVRHPVVQRIVQAYEKFEHDNPFYGERRPRESQGGEARETGASGEAGDAQP